MRTQEEIRNLYAVRKDTYMKKLNELSAAEADIRVLQEECEHPNIKEEWGDGFCPDCHFKTVGWFCPTSPTFECDYYDKETDEYDEDRCIYCGDPEERK